MRDSPSDITNRRLSTTLYVSPEFLRLEFERMWSCVWQVVGLAADIGRPGDYFTYQIGNESFLVVRQIDGIKALGMGDRWSPEIESLFARKSLISETTPS